ncbi:MAG TPA: OB-fold domain-containing protein [Polyangiales bacterium]|nr:OB-fold domain-containing protein [Polyangiales bacterium]
MPELDLERISNAYTAGLQEGRLLLQRCSCGALWLPPRAACDKCLGAPWTWHEAGGGGTLYSWVIYHVAFHPEFRDRLPYNVALVELDEGPRMITNIVDDNELLTAHARVTFVKPDAAAPLARFRLER